MIILDIAERIRFAVQDEHPSYEMKEKIYVYSYLIEAK